MKIKGYSLGTGKPVICVPITETGKNEIRKAAQQGIKQGAAALEWRMDWYSQVDQWNQVEEVLEELSEMCRNTILLCTFRSKAQGGQREIAEETYRLLLKSIAGNGGADLLDVEVRELLEASDVIEQLHGMGQKVIGSQHYFSYTPDVQQMRREFQDMQRTGADIGKLAVMPQTSMDVIHLMEAAAGMKESSPEYLLAAMAMGGLGAVSRVSGQLFGSCITFASAGKASAPGQLLIEDTIMILDKLSESMGRE
ncbi:MAG: type I 3-dehydroquinate dehydratase [Lachnospiraceae bacterium]|nr:type I 3-dehydroquinate dehydratase [Lachnospiraceae bacterium]